MNNITERIGRILIVNVPRELDHHSASIIREETELMFRGNKIKYVIFNFSETKFMDSSGIGLIMGRYNEVRLQGGSVCVTNVSTNLEKIITLSGLYKVINKYSFVNEAIEAFS